MNPQDISNTVAPALQAIPLKPLLPTVIIVEKAWTSYKLFFKRLWPLSLATIGVGAIGVILLYAGFFYTIFSGQQGNFPASAVGPLYLVTLGCVFLVIVLFLAIFLRGVTDLYKSDFQGIGVAYSRNQDILAISRIDCRNHSHILCRRISPHHSGHCLPYISSFQSV